MKPFKAWAAKLLQSGRRLARYGVRVGTRTRVSRRAVLDASSGGGIVIGSDCTIHDYAMLLTYGGRIQMGNRSTVNPFCVLYGHGNLTIGSGVRIAAHTVRSGPGNLNSVISGNSGYNAGPESVW